MVYTIEEQVKNFASGTGSEYAFPAELTAQERKLVKKTAEKIGLPSCSYGMGSERRIHIFRPTAPTAQVLKPAEYSVKNTFVDSIMTQPSPSPGPAHQSMPVGGFQEHIAAEEEAAVPQELGATLVEKLDVMLGKASNGEQSGGSTVDSESESSDPAFSIKNTFVHFETDSDENADPRIIQSMPSGKFAESIAADKQAGASAGNRRNLPLPFADEPEIDTERESELLFPATPNAEGHISALDDVPAFDNMSVPNQWISPPATIQDQSITVLRPATMMDSSITVLPPALWKPSPAQILIDSPISNKQEEQPQGPTHAQMPGSAAQSAPQVPSMLPPGTPVMVTGLASQPTYNGLHGLVVDFDSHHSRYNIVVEIGPHAQKSVVKVKPCNLIIVQPVLPPQPVYYPPVQQQAVPTRVGKASLCLDQMV
eukprot:gnl/MRDRNA2_/MRDRNA2_89117_c0_seq1.p1 gnl/MRDRNA2_/MRDRNA2_89117_c0~~gnl/MRDRNA2_/MRDRNA2_89117_c0_seq1.p1  ORF type:complete len:426 (-),score=93.36 gnl/MRDRNA2_/MRDRNA2_89117_c0_seq1:295-1572(-)